MVNEKFCRNLYIYKYMCILIYDIYIYIYPPVYLHIVKININ